MESLVEGLEGEANASLEQNNGRPPDKTNGTNDTDIHSFNSEFGDAGGSTEVQAYGDDSLDSRCLSTSIRQGSCFHIICND